MALTTLDPQTALVVIDLQKGVTMPPDASEMRPLTEVVRQTNALSEAFRRHGLPVALVVGNGIAPGRTEAVRGVGGPRLPDHTDLHAELKSEPNDIRVMKRTPGAFASTDLEKQLKALGVTQVVITGVATSNGVESTARQAYELGFNVTLPLDAMTDRSPENHEHSLMKVFPRLGETGTTSDIIDLLDKTR